MTEQPSTITIDLALKIGAAVAAAAAAWGGVRVGFRALRNELRAYVEEHRREHEGMEIEALRLRDRAHAHANVLAAHEARITVLEDK